MNTLTKLSKLKTLHIARQKLFTALANLHDAAHALNMTASTIEKYVQMQSTINEWIEEIEREQEEIQEEIIEAVES